MNDLEDKNSKNLEKSIISINKTIKYNSKSKYENLQ